MLVEDWRSGWPVVADLGVAAFCVPEEQGGFGLRVDAAVATAMELGAALHGAPYPGLTASAYVLGQVADEPLAVELLGGILSGERVCTFGQLSADGREARLVDGAADADALALLETSGEGLLLFLNPADWSARPSSHTFDVSRACADVTLKAGAGHRVASPGCAAELFRLLLSADAVGGVEHMLDRTVTYARQREAFGRPIGGFQVVQHRLVDHAVRARGMALLVNEAANLLSAGSPEARRFVAMAEVSVSSGATHILHDLLQLTGAIGFTWEYGLHYYERRAHTSARLAANPRAASRSLAQIEGWTHGR